MLAWCDRPESVKTLEYTCLGCGGDALLPINAADIAIAQAGQGIVCDHAPSPNLMPDEIECPHCRRRYERDLG